MEEAVEPARALFDVLTASRLDADYRKDVLSAVEAHGLLGKLATLPEAPLHRRTRRLMQAIPPFHFPIAFPEVFLKERPGFDVILGNPPWEKTQVEEQLTDDEKEEMIRELDAVVALLFGSFWEGSPSGGGGTGGSGS